MAWTYSVACSKVYNRNFDLHPELLLIFPNILGLSLLDQIEK